MVSGEVPGEEGVRRAEQRGRRPSPRVRGVWGSLTCLVVMGSLERREGPAPVVENTAASPEVAVYVAFSVYTP